MCGIAGIVSRSAKPVERGTARVQRMAELLRHRGPDAEGVSVAARGRVVFANTRLAIVDVQTNFAVPLVGADGTSLLTFNGEIYNYADERARLAQQGVRFRTSSDTEVLLEGLCREGREFLARLDGFWSFAFCEGAGGHTILARDVMGERQLYYRVTTDEVVFASEVNPILADMRVGPALDVAALAAAFRYRAAPPDSTLIEGVRRVRAGHFLEITPDGRIDERRYARLAPERWHDFFARRPSDAEVADLYDEQLYRACRSRVPSEVGCFATLSGGLDSALVNVYASDFGRVSIRSLYGESASRSPQVGSDLSERDASARTAKRLGNRHTVLDMRGDVASAALDAAENSFDGILCEGAIGFRLLAREVRRQGARVMILSDGPDELLGGYTRDAAAVRLDGMLDSGSKDAARATIRAGDVPPGLAGSDPGDRTNWTYLRRDPFQFRPVHGGTPEAHMHALFEDAAALASAGSYGTIDADISDTGLSSSQRMSLSYATQSLPGYFNSRSDRGVMRESVESRLPLQAPALAELMVATPPEYRYGPAGQGKQVLRALVERHVGPEVAHRGKYGFYTPPWQLPGVAAELRIAQTIGDSAVFEPPYFREGARAFLMAPENIRLAWFAFCVAKVFERLRARDFGYSVPIPAHTDTAPSFALATS